MGSATVNGARTPLPESRTLPHLPEGAATTGGVASEDL
jgi:hypothetical protein